VANRGAFQADSMKTFLATLTRPAAARAVAAALASAALIYGVGPVAAQQTQVMETPANVLTKRISMGVGKSIIVDLPRDASEIFIGNPKVANAVVRSAHKLYVIGMDNGQTSVFALDAQGRQIAVLEISIGRDIGELQQVIRAAMPSSSVVARTVNDTIILTGEVDTAEEAQRVADIAKGFAKQVNQTGASAEGLVVNSMVIRGRTQVMLKVTVAEIQRTVAKQLGLTSAKVSGSWGRLTTNNPFGIQGPITGTGAAAAGSSLPTTAVANVLALSNPGGSLAANVEAFERYGVTRILAEPTVAAVSGENATFMVGGQFPIPGPAVACGTSTTATTYCSGGAVYQNYGVALNFTPVVLSEGRILLHLSTEVTDINYATQTTINGTPVPGLLTRKNATSVELPSGGSIASAGLLQTQTSQVINGLPGLMNLPILGTLFRSRDYQKQETELLIVVTPYIVKPVSASQLPRPDDGFSDASDPQTALLGRINRLYASPNNPQAIQNFKGKIGFIQD